MADKHLPHHLWHCSSFSCAHKCVGEGVTGQADHNIFTPRVKTIFRSLFRYYKYRYYKTVDREYMHYHYIYDVLEMRDNFVYRGLLNELVKKS